MDSEPIENSALAGPPAASGAAIAIRGVSTPRFHRPVVLLVAAGVLGAAAFVSLGLSVVWLPLLYLPLLSPTLSRAGIRRWVRRLGDPVRQAEAERSLLVAARRPWFSTGDRLDGLGELLLVRLERGDFAGACALVELRPSDSAARRRPRTREHGQFGEVVFSLLGWLVPGHEALALDTSMFRPDALPWEDRAIAMDPSLAQLVGLHATVQHSVRGLHDQAFVEWNGIDHLGLRRDRPVLHALVLASLARVRPGCRDDLHAALASLSSSQRELVVRIYPEWSEWTSVTDRAPYRLPARRGVVDDTRMPAVIDPRVATTFWDRWFPARATGHGALSSIAGASILIPLVSLWWFAGTSPWLVLPFVFAALTLVIAPWLLADRRRHRRLAPLRAAGIVNPPRLAEFRRLPTRFHTHSGVADQMPFDAAELLLFATLHNAERSIIDGGNNLDEAVELLRPRLLEPESFISPIWYGEAIAASWTRTAAILGKLAGLPCPPWQFTEDAGPAQGGVARSGHGNHPAALALARSLALALDGRWQAASEAFAAAASRVAQIALDDGERRIYGELARALQAHGFEVPPPLRTLLDAPSLPALASQL